MTFSCDSAIIPVWFYSPIVELDSVKENIRISSVRSKTLTLDEMEILETGFYYCYGIDPQTSLNFFSGGELRIYGIHLVFNMHSYL